MRISSITSKVGKPCSLASLFESDHAHDRFVKGAGFKSVSRFEKDVFTEARELCSNHRHLITESDVIIVVSQHVRKICPPPSSLILADFKCLESQVIDLNLGCSGFLDALVISESYSRQNLSSCIVCADSYPAYSSRFSRTVDAVFGEAVTITRIIPSFKNDYEFRSLSVMWPQSASAISYDNSEKQMLIDGAALMELIRMEVVSRVNDFIGSNGYTIEQFDQIFVHQGSKFVIEAFRSGFAIGPERCRFEAAEIGNCNASSIPLMIRPNEMPENGKFLFVAFGVGLKLTAVVLSFDIH